MKEIDYYKNNEILENSYYQIPQELFVNNLYKNYYSQGLDTVEKIAPRYAEGSSWPAKINSFVEKIRNS